MLSISIVEDNVQHGIHQDLQEVAKELGWTPQTVILSLLDAGCTYQQISFSFSISKSTISAAKGKISTKPPQVVVTDLPPEIKLPGDCTGFVVDVKLSPTEIRWLQSRFIKQSIREKLDEAMYKWRSQRK